MCFYQPLSIRHVRRPDGPGSRFKIEGDPVDGHFPPAHPLLQDGNRRSRVTITRASHTACVCPCTLPNASHKGNVQVTRGYH